MATSAADIQKLYIAYFNRPADTAGLAFWQARADAAGSVEAIADQFSNSTEYTDLFNGASNFDIVNTLYINLFGRAAEDAGLKYWAGKLASGELTVGTVAYTIANSAQGSDLIAVTNKVSAADQFTSTLTPDEIIGYSGTSPNAVAKAWLSSITTNATLTAGINNLDTVQSNAAAARGDALTLAAGADTFVGKNFNDTITGTAANLTIADSIDGGFGVDTLNLSAIGTGTFAGSVKNVEKINLTGAAAATVNSAFFVGSTDISVDGAATKVTNVDAQTITFANVLAINNEIDYVATATSAAVKLVNSTGTIALNGAGLTSATLTGTSTGAVGLSDTAGKITSLTVGLSGADTTLGVSTLTALTSINAAGSRADLTIDASALTKLATLSTGSGADIVTIDKTFSAANTGTTLNVTTGEGNDIINVKVAGIAAAAGATPAVTGTVSIDGGAGADTFNVALVAELVGATLNGGEGIDTMSLGGTSFTAAQYGALNTAATAIEVAQFVGAAAVDGSFLTEFNQLSFTADGAVVTNASEAITTAGDISVSGVGYSAASGAIAATYGSGSVDLSITANAKTVTVNANTAVVTVASDAATIGTTINGDVKDLLTVNVNSSIDPADKTVQYAASATVTVDATHNTALKAVSLVGDGAVTLNNSAGVALTTIDASKLGGLDLAGLVTGGLTFTGNAALAETISLGSGKDVITVNSTYKAMDTITGFDAVQESATVNKSVVDTLVFNGVTIDGSGGDVVKLTLASTVTNLTDALQAAATSSAAQTGNGIVTFQFGGDTYLFKDLAPVANEGVGALGNNDLVVKLTGTIDLAGNFATHV